MTTVFTNVELKNALNAGVKHIHCKGAVADALVKSRKAKAKSRRRKVIVGALLAAASITAAPFTLGTSLGAGAIAGMGAVATGLTIGSCTISTAELAIICGTLVALAGHKLHCRYNHDGTVDVEVE